MPPVVAAIAAALTISTAMATVVLISAIIMVAAIAYSVYAFATMKKSGYGGSNPLRDRTQVVRSAVEPRQYIYGQVMISGPLIYTLSTGPTNEYLYLVIALADHEVEEIGDVYLSDKLATDSLYSGSVTITKYLGTTDQEADANLIDASGGQWTVDHRLRGVAYLVVRLTYSSSVFPNGIPNIKAVVKGNNQIYDPRTEITGYTNNWALCIRDYLIKEYGIGCLYEDINGPQAIAAANICDEDVTLASGGTEKRYTMNGTFSAGDKPLDIMKRMLTGAVGSVVWSQGQYYIHPAAYCLPESYVITESDLAGPLGVQPAKSGRDKFNTVRGTFADPADYWQPVDFPPVVNSVALSADGRELVQDIELQYTTSSAAAQRLAKIHLERELQGIVVSLTGKMTLFGFKPGDVVLLSIASMGWVEKEFRVTNWQMEEQGQIRLALREESSASYDWNSGLETVIDPAPDTMLPSPFTVQPPADITCSDEVYGGASGLVIRLLVSLQAAADAFVSRYEVQAKQSSSTTWVTIGTGLDSELAGVESGATYQVRARAYNAIGAASGWITAEHLVAGLSASPSDVPNIRVTVVNTEAHLYWDAVTDAGVSHYIIRYSPLPGGSWASSVDLIPQAVGTAANVPAMQGTYLIKAVRIGGAESLNAASIYNAVGAPPLNAVETYTAETAWTGTLSNLTNTAGVLSLTSLTTIPAVGSFIQTGSIDLGQVFTSRVSATLTAAGTATGSTMSTWTTLSGVSPLSGTEPGDWSALLEMRTTSDDPAASPIWSSWQAFSVGDYSARAYQFRLTVTSNSAGVQVQVSGLTVTVDMPDRTITMLDQTCLAAGLRVDFSPPYRSLKSVVIDAANMATGDYKTITNKDETGFNVRFYNAAGTGVERVFDAVAVGYGEVT